MHPFRHIRFGIRTVTRAPGHECVSERESRPLLTHGVPFYYSNSVVVTTDKPRLLRSKTSGFRNCGIALSAAGSRVAPDSDNLRLSKASLPYAQRRRIRARHAYGILLHDIRDSSHTVMHAGQRGVVAAALFRKRFMYLCIY